MPTTLITISIRSFLKQGLMETEIPHCVNMASSYHSVYCLPYKILNNEKEFYPLLVSIVLFSCDRWEEGIARDIVLPPHNPQIAASLLLIPWTTH